MIWTLQQVVESLETVRNEEKSLEYYHAGSDQSLTFPFMCPRVCCNSDILAQKHFES